MAWHVHHKNGKFNIWSTFVDDYVLTEWVDEKVIIEAFKQKAEKDAVELAKEKMQRAKENGCSAYKPARCDPKDF